MKTDWNFKLLYKSDIDPQIKRDLGRVSSDFDRFAKKWGKDKSYLKNNTALLKALNEYEKVTTSGLLLKPYLYFFFRKDDDAKNKVAQVGLNNVQTLFSENFNKVIFFTIELGKLSAARQKSILNDNKLGKYKYFLECIFKTAKYDLSVEEEKVINLMSQPASTMWSNAVSKILNNKEIVYKGKKISVGQAMSMLSNENKAGRKILDTKLKEVFKETSDFSEAEINAIYTSKKISDELKGYEKPYTSTVIGYQNEVETVENLVDVVTKGFNISKRFYKLKTRMMKEDHLFYRDRSAKIGEVKAKFDFKNSVEILRKSFGKFEQKYVDILNDYLKNGQINVYPKLGKTSGAYCWGDGSNPTFVLLNHTDDLNSLTTFAHEMGHAFHTELSSTQEPIYRDYTISVAEVASTLFENFVFDEVFESLNKREQIIALHDKINSHIATIFRQVACFNFENELHKEIREKGYLSSDEISKLLVKHMKAYIGPSMKFEDEDGLNFIYWSHIRRFFYVYSYASGSLISSALYAKYLEDETYKEKIESFLKAGGSKSPEDIFGDIGIDIRDPEFFKAGLKQIEKDIKKLEKLVN